MSAERITAIMAENLETVELRETDRGLLRARVRVSLALSYLSDLEAERNGDGARFLRMVDGRGKQVGFADAWTASVQRILSEPLSWYAPRFPEAYQRALELGIDLDGVEAPQAPEMAAA